MTDAVLATSYGGPEVLEVRDVEVPAPRNGQVTIDVRAAGVNPYDYKVYSGMLGSDESRLNELYREHGLPACQPPAAWPAGERRTLGDPEVAAFAEGVHRRSAAKPRAKRKTATSE